jgi:serine phosphatase RsbU (regulator of sigma subunit)
MPGRWRVGSTRIQGVVVDACWRPAVDAHCGDFHDVIDLHDGCVAVVIGDVAGSGLDAWMHAERLTAVVRSRLREEVDLEPVLAELDVATHAAKDELLVTMVVAVIDPSSRSVQLVNAGHLPPVATGLGGGRFVDGDPNPPLGVSCVRSVIEHELERDGVLYAATDGLVERRWSTLDEGLRVFVDACVEGTVATASAVEVAARITEQLGQPSDDATVVSVRLLDGA